MREPDPDYCCALLEDARGRLLLQLRPLDARHAPGQLTCFGGRRRAREAPLACLMRELDEELGWHPDDPRPCCDLRTGDHLIARFWRAPLEVDRDALRLEVGHAAILAPWASVPGLPVSPWHRAVLRAVRSGRDRVEVT